MPILPEKFSEYKSKALQYQAKKKYDVAITEFQHAMTALDFRKRKHRLAAVEVRIRIGDLYQVTRQWDAAACNAYRGLRGIEQNKGSTALRVRSLAILGIAEWYRNGPSAALKWFRPAQKLIEGNRWIPPLQRMEVLDNFGLCLFLTGEAEKAKKFQQKALKIAKKNKLFSACEEIKRRLANTCQDTGDLEMARHLLADVQPDDKADPLVKVKWRNSSALLAVKRGFIGEAINHFDNALDVLPENEPDRISVAALLSNTALLMLDIGMNSSALSYAEVLFDLDLNQAPLSTRLGECRVRAALKEAAGKHADAVIIHQEIIDLIDGTSNNNSILLVDAIVGKAKALIRIHREKEAMCLLSETIRQYGKEGGGGLPIHVLDAANTLAGMQIEAGQVSMAKALLVEIAKSEIPQGRVAIQMKMMANLAEISAAQNKLHGAVIFGKIYADLLSKSVADASITNTSRHAYLQRHERTLRRLAERLAELARIPEALMICALIRNEYMTQLANPVDQRFEAQPAVFFQKNEKQLSSRWKKLCQEAVHQQAELNDWRNSSPIKKRAAKRLDHLRSCVGEILNEILEVPEKPNRRHLSIDYGAPAKGPDDVHIQFGIAGERIVVRTIQDAQTSVYELSITTGELARNILKFRQEIEEDNSHYLETGHWIYKALFAPLGLQLHKGLRLHLSLDGVLFHLPFSCLFDGENYLVEKVELGILDQCGMVQRGRKSFERKATKIVAFGAGLGSDGKSPLNFTGTELEAIAQLNSNARIFQDEAFTSSRLLSELAGHPTHLHIAGHFHLEPGAFFRSFMELGDGSKLYLSELISGPYDFSGIECVTFSACNTATVDQGKDAIESLAAVALAKGARSVVGSLWAVDDFYTSSFMACFYGVLLEATEPVTASTALRKTQRIFANSTGHDKAHFNGGIGVENNFGSFSMSSAPHHWAGFTHYSM